MIQKWIKRMLGIDVLENQVARMQDEKAGLEAKVIDAENAKALVKSAAEKSRSETELNSEAEQFLKGLDIEITNDTSAAALSGIKAADVVERYGLKRFSPETNRGYNTPIITIEELQNHPADYMHKLGEGFMNFPLPLNFTEANKMLGRKFRSDIGITTSNVYSNNGTVQFNLGNLIGDSMINLPGRDDNAINANQIMLNAGELSQISRKKSEGNTYIDSVDFLANCDGLIRFVSELPEISEERKKNAISAFEMTRFTLLTSLETVGKTRINELSDLLKYNSNEKPVSADTEIELDNPGERLKREIKMSFYAEMDGTSYHDLDHLLQIRSKEKFTTLASEITAKILANDRQRRGLTTEINKPLSEYSIGEALVLSAYFARNVITKYKKLEDSIKEIFLGEKNSEVSGKCTDYTALTLHYLREYLIPMQPEKFENWQFAVESSHIGDYRHSYIRIVHIKPDLSADVYFADPTALANRGINELKSPKDVISGVDAKKIPVLIRRDAEDLLYSANEKMGKEK